MKILFHDVKQIYFYIKMNLQIKNYGKTKDNLYQSTSLSSLLYERYTKEY